MKNLQILPDEAIRMGAGFGNQSIQEMMVRQRHPCGGTVSSGSAVATAFAPAPTRSLGGSPGVDADCGLRRRHLEDGGSGFVVRGRLV